jgi:hypothetical protein
MKYFLAHVLIVDQDGNRDSAIVPIVAADLNDAIKKNEDAEASSGMASPTVTVIERNIFETTRGTLLAIIATANAQFENLE